MLLVVGLQVVVAVEVSRIYSLLGIVVEDLGKELVVKVVAAVAVVVVALIMSVVAVAVEGLKIHS